MQVLVTFTNPVRDMVHEYKGQRPGWDVAGRIWAEYAGQSDLLAVGAFDADGNLLGAVHRGHQHDPYLPDDQSFETLFVRELSEPGPICEWCGKSVDDFTTLDLAPYCSAECQECDAVETVWQLQHGPHTSPDE